MEPEDIPAWRRWYPAEAGKAVYRVFVAKALNSNSETVQVVEQ